MTDIAELAIIASNYLPQKVGIYCQGAFRNTELPSVCVTPQKVF